MRFLINSSGACSPPSACAAPSSCATSNGFIRLSASAGWMAIEIDSMGNATVAKSLDRMLIYVSSFRGPVFVVLSRRDIPAFSHSPLFGQAKR
ncbi:hypothetical protein LP421_06695 [Rhizobium sp. RCAM05350]|nr:hypothetical protein LP421_06695 [Rhizobium sp. RCAM05350]